MYRNQTPGKILPHLGTIPRPKGFPIEGKKHMKELRNKFDMGFNEINHKIDMKATQQSQTYVQERIFTQLD
jgi:hypothetical protein